VNAVVDAASLGAALDALVEIARLPLVPAEAERHLRRVVQPVPDARLRLVWQHEAHDGSLHYDLLITRPGVGTVSLSYAPLTATPWALRGGRRARDRTLLRVDGVEVDVGEAIDHLDLLWSSPSLKQRLVNACLVRQELRAEDLALDDDDLQRAMDASRRARGLLTVAETTAWLESQDLSLAEFEELVRQEAAVRNLRRRVARPDVRAYFGAHRHGLQVVQAVQVTFALRGAAQAAAAHARQGCDLLAEARTGFLASPADTISVVLSRSRRDELGDVDEPDRGDAPSRPGPDGAPRLLGPTGTAGGWCVTQVLDAEEATLDEATVETIERRLFDRWLERRRAAAQVEWFWGPADDPPAGRLVPRRPCPRET
jgi:putative peptide maturation system protein